METASSNERPVGPVRRTASRVLAWSKGRWARFTSGLGGHGGKAARLVVLPLLFVVGLGVGLIFSQWSARLPEEFDVRSGAALQVPGAEQELADAPGGMETGMGVGAVATTSEGAASRTAAGNGMPVLSDALVWPAEGMVVATAGWRRHPEHGDWRYLPGLELAVPSQAPVRAAADGRVSSVEAGS